MRSSLIICTYNSTRCLDYIFCGLSRQTQLPDEILIAADGSTPETAALIESWAKQLDTRVEHVWQADRGFRKCRISNEAVRRSTGDHLIFLDGDAIPHSHFIEDHLLVADDKQIMCGRRVKLGPKTTARLTREAVLAGKLERIFGPVLRGALLRDNHRFRLSIRLPQEFAKFMHPSVRKLMGVNFAVPRALFYEVNGYDEVEGIRGRIDRDLELRMLRTGAPRYPLLNRALCYHMHHEERGIDDTTKRWCIEQEASDRIRCELGLDSPFDATS